LAVTIRDIAKQTGISTATVSRGMNPDTRDCVRSARRDRVLEVIEKENYYPNVNAQNLGKKAVIQ